MADRDSILRDLVHEVPDLLCIAGTDGYFKWLSPQWENTLGWSMEELTSTPFLELVHPADRDDTIQEVARLNEGHNTVNFENRYRRSDGGYAWLQWNASPSPDGTLYCSARDITIQKEAQQKLQERTRLLEMAEGLADVGHWRVDLATDDPPLWSPQVYAIYGRDPEEWTPSLDKGIEGYHPDDRERVSAAVQSTIETREPFRFEARVVRPDGEVRHVVSQGMAEVNRSGAVVSIFGIIRDLTEEKGMQRALLHSERMVSLGTMAAGIAHEINNPLGYVTGNMELAAELLDTARRHLPPAAANDMEEMLDHALEGARRIQKIVQGMGSFSRVADQERVPTDIRSVMQAALEIVEHQVQARGQLVSKLESVPPVDADENQLVQVLINLLMNAAQALPQDQDISNRVEVSLKADGGNVIIRVSDTGPGIPENLRERIFDPFFTTKPVGSGTGLGLSIAHTIVASHGGTIEVTDRPGGGATFVIRLPLSAQGAETTDPVGPAGPTSADGPGKPRILVVDDEARIVAYAGRALREDYEVVTAGSGREALEALAEGPDFAAILCDLMMPEVSGMDVYAEIARSHPALLERFLVITGGAFTSGAEDFLTRTDVPVMRKPLSLVGLREAVAELVQPHHADTAGRGS